MLMRYKQAQPTYWAYLNQHIFGSKLHSISIRANILQKFSLSNFFLARLFLGQSWNSGIGAGLTTLTIFPKTG